ncbi:MAG: peptidoglycan DD-metalloendopeptidase family protein [Bifidobacteriaceae bacterium]|jgi:murein DD-endopeptidase MepM/ murein hydrolase activator NlpD|nr:peptidoglycan DD-metalloendopeptidase family protein [Bifidobacteriaceae bacterium]
MERLRLIASTTRHGYHAAPERVARVPEPLQQAALEEVLAWSRDPRPQADHPDPDFSDPAFPDPTFADPTYPDPSYPDPTFADPTYPAPAPVEEAVTAPALARLSVEAMSPPPQFDEHAFDELGSSSFQFDQPRFQDADFSEPVFEETEPPGSDAEQLAPRRPIAARELVLDTFRGARSALARLPRIRLVPSLMSVQWFGRQQWRRLADLVERLRIYLRCHTERAAAIACAGLLAGSIFMGVGGAAGNAAPLAQTDALSPLADTIEVVSRRNMAQLTSRSMTAQVAEAASVAQAGPEIEAANQSNVGLILKWDVSELANEPDARLILRRGAGDAPPQTPAEGVGVPLGDDPGSVVDSGLQPDTAYSYTLFIQRPNEKPEVLSQLVASTRRYPTELTAGAWLAGDDRLTSPSNNHFVAVEPDGGIVLFNNRNQKLWSLDTDRTPGATVSLGVDGVLVVKVGEAVIWTADASGPGARLVLTDQGVLQLLGRDGQVTWSSAQQGYQLRGGDSPYGVSADGWTQPGAGPVSSGYGMRLHPIYGVVKLHAGVDMTGSRGKPIYAAHDGVVTRVYQDSGGNWTIEISHGNEISTRYLHMDGLGGILVKEGDDVVRGEQIALTGNSGQSTGPHLHFEVSVNGQTTDPVAFLKEHGIVIQ